MRHQKHYLLTVGSNLDANHVGVPASPESIFFLNLLGTSGHPTADAGGRPWLALGSEEQMKVKVYIAGPYTQGDVAQNVRNAIEAANKLADLGFAPFVPHFTHFWHMIFPRPYAFWLELDNQFLPCCDAILRIPGPSNGADKEVALAEKLGKPVFRDIESLVKHFGSGGRG